MATVVSAGEKLPEDTVKEVADCTSSIDCSEDMDEIEGEELCSRSCSDSLVINVSITLSVKFDSFDEKREVEIGREREGVEIDSLREMETEGEEMLCPETRSSHYTEREREKEIEREREREK